MTDMPELHTRLLADAIASAPRIRWSSRADTPCGPTASVHALETAPLSARFTVSDPATGQECEVDILKETFWRPVTQSPYGPVLAEEGVIGIKVRALADRGAPRDLLDVFTASRRWTNAELEEFGRRHARGRFERGDLQSNLTGAEWADDLATRHLEEAGDVLGVWPAFGKVIVKGDRPPGHAGGRTGCHTRCHTRSATHWRNSGSRRNWLSSRSNT
ncbi:hypothetical protein GCM10012286_13580 [Streptomyces lasiicapitis]|uniref:Uncharacterized protein n=1 Tax=Streptomyces lasiicapitis TaxID=1923961 RepID=A0ABQ2LKN1_9ACTN|nr:hypothetical protein GCM10012286_13580 [Streptomyces lasiicapitis]